jgi:alcohol dehydrogenase class IV
VTAPTFEFATAGQILAGAGRAAELPGVVAGLGSRVLVCTGADPARHGGLLAGLGLPAALFAVATEPTVELARAGVAAAREHGADVVAAVGGGSVIDLGKAVAMLLGNGGDPLDYLEVVGSGRRITQPAAPCVAVPTTAGTGAEVTANAVLASPAHGLKASLRSPLMIPRVALVDPELTVSCPPRVTAASGLDALTQCLACAALLAPVTEANVRALRSGPAGHPALGRYTEAARLLTGSPAASIEDGLTWIRETVSLLAVPGLAAFGIGPQHAAGIAAKAASSSSMRGNPVTLTHSDLSAVVHQAL